jgi:patatin-like phospholipase/acyl hydrolase
MFTGSFVCRLFVSEQLMWKVARSTSAAPFYFPEFEERFLDGGLIANNPTIDTLTEIQQINNELKSQASQMKSSLSYIDV